MTDLPFTLDREILIRARRATVFRFFLESELFARWWGAGSTIEGRVGGRVHICMPGNVLASGEVLDLAPAERIVFTFGYASGKPIPPGGSRVTVTLRDHAEGTLLTLHHELADAAARDHHVQGWRYQLAVFANVAADAEHAALADLLQHWFDAWNETDTARRADALAACATDDVSFRDRYGCVAGRNELLAHIAAVSMHMPGLRLQQKGAPRHCQGVALVDWEAVGADGGVRARGTNVVLLAPGGVRGVVGFWT